MAIPADLHYTREHEWVKVEGDVATVGITDYAQSELGDIVFVELPEVGRTLEPMQAFGVIEAVKAVSDLFSPVHGEVIARNEAVTADSGIINREPFGGGWLIQIRLTEGMPADLLDAEAYAAHTGSH